MLEKAAVKVSFGEPRKKFLNMAAFLRDFGTTTIDLIHVAAAGQSGLKEAAAQLEELGREVGALGFTVQTHLRQGSAPPAIVGAAEERDVDYLALYWMPKPLLRNALLGSIDSDILRLSCLPVFIYNPKLFKAAEGFESVLYATDFTYTDAVVLPYLVNRKFKARKLYLLHVGNRAPDPVTEEQRRQGVLDNLQRLARECAHAYEDVEVVQTIGLTRNQIVKQAGAKDVDLIVAGKSENPDALSQVVGSTAEILPHKAGCSVFIIPGICRLPSPEEEGGQGGRPS